MVGGEPHPALSRRREVSHTSARSLLMTVLGEFVLLRERPVWTATLVHVLGLFGVEEKSARQALSRTSAEGWLHAERIGRRVRWSLSSPGQRLLSEGASRIYDFGRAPGNWDGTWLVLLVSVPEAQRDLRHRLRTQLSWAGFGSPAPGVWISPNSEREQEAERILAELGVAGPMSFIASYGRIGERESMVARSWDLSAVEQRYESFIEQFRWLTPSTGKEALYAQTRLVHEWRRFPFLDPQLPAELLPRNWSGTQAAELFHDKHARWRELAQQHWEKLVGSAEPA